MSAFGVIRQQSEDGAIVVVGGDTAARAAREALYNTRLDPQSFFDDAIDRVAA